MDLRPFFDRSSDFLAVSRSGTPEWTLVNGTLAARLGWSPEEVLDRNLVDGGNPGVLPCSDGTELHVDWKIVPGDGVDYWIGREALPDVIREVHHRVKNHLQMLISLISLQASESPDEAVAESLAVARARVQAVARLYEPLYTSADFEWIEFGAYVRALAGEHMDTGSTIETSDVVLEIGQALPLSLIAADTLQSSPRSVELAYVAPDRIVFTAIASDTLDLPDPEVVRLLAEQLGADLVVHDDRLSVTFTIYRV